MVTIKDAKDGLRISIFMRRGRIYAYKIDELGRFVRRVRAIGMELTATLSYRGKKANDIYIDTKVGTVTKPEDIYFKEKSISEQLENYASSEIRAMFGSVIADMVEVSGIEFFEEFKEPDYPHIRGVILWKHHKYDEWREKTLDEWL